jgi:two-component system response regulator HydG
MAKSEKKTKPMPWRVLIVDNDKDHARAMTESLERIGLECTCATSGPDGAELIEKNVYDIVVTDLMMTDFDGMKILSLANEKLPDAEVLMVTGHATIPRAVEAMQQGANNFLEKPITPKRLQTIAMQAAEKLRLKQQNNELHSRLDEKFGFENLIYASDSMKRVVESLKRIAPTDAGVLITGETGTGKDVIAQAIHQNSPRKKKPFVAINTAAVAEHLVESELFGHVKGAFTDAITDRLGKFEYADGGTLFLDEIGDMPMATQIKMLRVLEDRKITKVGDNKEIDVNVRVLAATNKDLEAEIEAGRFRSDLYYRLNIVTVNLAPLRERRDDILPLANYFRKSAAKKNNKPSESFSQELRRWMLNFPWKGNVRRLKNVVESLVVMDIDGTLDLDDLSPDLLDQSPPSSLPGGTDDNATGGDTGSSHLIGQSLKEIEIWAIKNTLKLTGGNRKETAKILKISERSLYRALDKYDLE